MYLDVSDQEKSFSFFLPLLKILAEVRPELNTEKLYEIADNLDYYVRKLLADSGYSTAKLFNILQISQKHSLYQFLHEIFGIRRVALKRTEFKTSQCSTIRLKLLKIGAVVIHNTRRLRIMLSSSYPWQALFKLVANRLVAA